MIKILDLFTKWPCIPKVGDYIIDLSTDISGYRPFGVIRFRESAEISDYNMEGFHFTYEILGPSEIAGKQLHFSNIDDCVGIILCIPMHQYTEDSKPVENEWSKILKED